MDTPQTNFGIRSDGKLISGSDFWFAIEGVGILYLPFGIEVIVFMIGDFNLN